MLRLLSSRSSPSAFPWRRVASFAGLALLLMAGGAAAKTLTCQDHGSYVVCDNGLTYILSGNGGGNTVIIQPSPPQPDPQTPAITEDMRDDFEDILRALERQARTECRSVGWAASGQRKLCQRQTLERLVRETNDSTLQYFFEHEYRLRD